MAMAVLMLWVKKGTHIIDHERFLQAGALARDLYEWGMLYAGKHETDGELPMVAVCSSAWGYGTRANVKLADTLVRVGLWQRTASGYLILRWAEQGNQTKKQIAEDRASARERMGKRRSASSPPAPFEASSSESCSGELQANFVRTSENVPTSTSTSDLLSRSEEPKQIGSADPGQPPTWFGVALEVIAMGTGVSLPAVEAWLRYEGHRAGKGIAPTTKDAQYWLTSVMVPEAREILRRDARDKDRGEQFRRDKLGVAPKPQDSSKVFRERDAWEQNAGPPDPATALRMKKLLGGVG